MNATPHAQAKNLEHLQTLTREYAKFSKSAAGWGSIIGGALGLALYAIITQFPNLPTWARVLCGFVPILWITAKQLLQRRYYQRLGQVLENDPNPKWVMQLIQGGLLGMMICLTVTGLVALFIRPEKILSIAAPQLVMLVILCAYGLWASFQLNSVVEMLVALQLFLNAFFILIGSENTPGSLWALPACSALLLLIGIYEHLQYKIVEGQLKKFRSAS